MDNKEVIREYLEDSIKDLKIAIGEYVIHSYHNGEEYNKESLDEYANENVIIKRMLDSLDNK